MDASQLLSYIGKVGEVLSNITQKIIVWLSQLGVSTTPLSAKVINLILFLSLAYLFIKVLTIPKTLIKWAIIVLLIFLVVSTGASFIG